ncbi:ACT domain-containing protein [Actinomycetospora straminea]|uniref:ACT domain-containing protein n=1 Tax=Actinomycetospora straminea TaxID=663607 RepID=A0ABP9EJI7_9PSEU|nr:ACT domain-containing protein [Actinomycetospora straminea]MDD7932164.1 ACT domain-containing protein [Actinomycetospora straminea]
MRGDTDLDRLLAGMAPLLHPERYVWVTVTALPPGLDPLATIREDEGVSAVVTAGDADTYGLAGEFPCAGITLRVHSALEAVGFLAAIARALSDAGISTNAVAGFHHDHLFVPWERRDDAMDVLRGLTG